jgi:hypothetical protein
MTLRIMMWLMLLLFLFAVVVQYNDPDPVSWMAIYGAAAVACILWLRRRMPRWLPAVTGIVALIWAVIWSRSVLGQVAFRDLFREAGMATLEIEEGRELLGLLLVAIWMLVLFIASAKSTQRDR